MCFKYHYRTYDSMRYSITCKIKLCQIKLKQRTVYYKLFFSWSIFSFHFVKSSRSRAIMSGFVSHLHFFNKRKKLNVFLFCYRTTIYLKCCLNPLAKSQKVLHQQTTQKLIGMPYAHSCQLLLVNNQNKKIPVKSLKRQKEM